MCEADHTSVPAFNRTTASACFVNCSDSKDDGRLVASVSKEGNIEFQRLNAGAAAGWTANNELALAVTDQLKLYGRHATSFQSPVHQARRPLLRHSSFSDIRRPRTTTRSEDETDESPARALTVLDYDVGTVIRNRAQSGYSSDVGLMLLYVLDDLDFPRQASLNMSLCSDDPNL